MARAGSSAPPAVGVQAPGAATGIGGGSHAAHLSASSSPPAPGLNCAAAVTLSFHIDCSSVPADSTSGLNCAAAADPIFGRAMTRWMSLVVGDIQLKAVLEAAPMGCLTASHQRHLQGSNGARRSSRSSTTSPSLSSPAHSSPSHPREGQRCRDNNPRHRKGVVTRSGGSGSHHMVSLPQMRHPPHGIH